MKTDPLIQQLFAIERALGCVTNDQLRAMIIDAQEAALEYEVRNLHEIETLRQRLEATPDARPFTVRRFLHSDDHGPTH